MEASIVNDVNEPVYLLESGWIPSSCYTSIAYTHQAPELGRPSIVMQVDAKHNGINHKNDGQFVLINFTSPAPEGATMYVNGNPIEFYPGDRTLARGITGWDQEVTDNIGAGDMTLSFGFPEGWTAEQQLAYAQSIYSLIPSAGGIEFTDWSYRIYV